MSFLLGCVKLPAMSAQAKSIPRTQDHELLGQAFKLLIAEKQLSQSKVAARSGLDVRQINKLTLGLGNPTYLTLLRVCDGLGITPAELTLRAEKLKEERFGSQSRDTTGSG
jgi:transcriptional regulator with XRE-family HTH domain